MRLIRWLFSPPGLVAGTGLVAFGLVAGGLVLARTLNLAACPLCILQRMLYLLLALEATLALSQQRSRNAAFRGLSLLMAVTAGTGVFIAGYQTWLQRFAKGASCAIDQPWWERLVDWAGQQVPWLFEATGLCSEAGWKFIGMSIAEWSLLAFSAMTVATLTVAILKTPYR